VSSDAHLMVFRKCDTVSQYASYYCFDNVSMGTLADNIFYDAPTLGVVARTTLYNLHRNGNDNASS